ncbi:RES domain-containing protein [Algoriphagus locisalis]|uniref:RES domain-containing protein n=1 Tax=Algoriphagus locisalis TaxID=305507 RepID=A0A1I6XJC8_9BACT|nr:RES family NAD+ phosphorylase [Algoriphagus locisalis]SFT38141.1 RES domain-containing protein [Algoriphagus locisalis]
MKVYRIAGKKYAGDISGSGAALFGGRWNRKGSPVLYTGENIEIALLEIVVHTPPAIVPALDILTLEIPDDSISEIEIKELPDNWSNYPAPSILAEIAEEWINSNRSIALKVPSSVIHSSKNYILNCRHPKYHRVKIIEHKEFRFDQRLIK